MDSIWPSIFTFLGVYTFAIISPGPNFILVSNTALTSSRKQGLLISFGIAVGSGIFAFSGLIGLLPLVHSIPFFAETMRFAGGGYLLWIGFDMIRTCRGELSTQVKRRDYGVSSVRPFRVGLVTNLTNPKAWAFYLSLFTLMIGTTFPAWLKVCMNAAMFIISLGWYSAITLLISSTAFQPFFLRFRPFIQSALGLILGAVAIKILLAV